MIVLKQKWYFSDMLLLKFGISVIKSNRYNQDNSNIKKCQFLEKVIKIINNYLKAI